jgi:hypothetical protein
MTNTNCTVVSVGSNGSYSGGFRGIPKLTVFVGADHAERAKAFADAARTADTAGALDVISSTAAVG